MQSVCSYMYLILLDLAKVINCAREGNVLNGRNLKVAAENGNWPPFFMIHEHPEYPGIYMYSGVMEQLLQELRGALNFTTTMLRYDPSFANVDQVMDGGGYFDPETKNWSGKIGMVLRNEVDFALGNKVCHKRTELVTIFSILFLFLRSLCSDGTQVRNS